MIFLSGLAPPWAHAMEEIFVAYTQACLRVVSWWSVDIPLVVWGLCFGKVSGVKYCLDLSGSIVECGQCPRPSPVSASNIYAAIVYVPGGLGSVCPFW